YDDEKVNPDGTRTVTLAGSIALGGKPTMNSYAVPEPSRFAAVVLQEALKEKGIRVGVPAPGQAVDFKAMAANYTADNVVAEHVSPTFTEEAKVTLKVSQNLHASSMPYILGAVLANKHTDVDQAGFDVENKFLTQAGLDLTGAVQSDGAGGAAYFTPDFMVH